MLLLLQKKKKSYQLVTGTQNHLYIPVVDIRDQQLIAFSLHICTREVLSMSELIILKFNYSDLFGFSLILIYKYRLR